LSAQSLRSGRVEYSGVYEDGWIAASGRVVLAPGPAGNLVMRAEVLTLPEQHLKVTVDGRLVASESVEGGPLDLRIPVPESRVPRTVELHWAGTTRLSADDPREAAALLKFLEVTPARTPTSIRLPGTLTALGGDYAGIFPDGWVEKEAHLVLAGGGAARLVLRGHVSLEREQRLDVMVDGERVFSKEVQPGPLDFRIAVPATPRDRRIDLRWTETARVGPDDPREAAALIRFIGVGAGSPPKAQRRIPEDLDDPDLEAGGIYEDGWVEETAHLVLAGGAKGLLVLQAEALDVPDQHLTVGLDGSAVVSQPVAPGPLHLRASIPPSESDRKVELQWAKTVPVGPDDPRRAAALLRFVGVSSGKPPTLAHLPSALSDPNFESTGIFQDGWAERHATAILAGGPAAQLTVRAEVLPTAGGQRLDVIVDGSVLESRSIAPGELDLRAPVPASASHRKLELCWAVAGPISEGDARQATARVTFLGIQPTR